MREPAGGLAEALSDSGFKNSCRSASLQTGLRIHKRAPLEHWFKGEEFGSPGSSPDIEQAFDVVLEILRSTDCSAMTNPSISKNDIKVDVQGAALQILRLHSKVGLCCAVFQKVRHGYRLGTHKRLAPAREHVILGESVVADGRRSSVVSGADGLSGAALSTISR